MAYLNDPAVSLGIMVPNSVIVQPLPDDAVCRVAEGLFEDLIDREDSINWKLWH